MRKVGLFVLISLAIGIAYWIGYERGWRERLEDISV